MRRFTLVAMLFLAALFVSLPARAQGKHGKKVQILTLMSEDAFEQAQALTIALKRAVTRNEAYSLGKGDFSLEVLMLALNCEEPPDANCQKQIAGKVGVDSYVWGTMSKAGGEVVAHLRLYEKGKTARETKLQYASNLSDASDDTLLNIAEDAFNKLLGAADGTLVLLAGSVTGEVIIDDELAGTIEDGRAEIRVAAGDHRVRIRAKGYNDAVGSVTIRPGQKSELALAPTATGSGGPGDSGTSGSGSSLQRVGGYVAIGVGGAAMLTGGYFWLQTILNNNDDDLQAYADKYAVGENACDHARANPSEPTDTTYNPDKVIEVCDANDTQRVLALIFGLSGAVLTGVGTYLVVSDSSGSEQARRPKPRFQPSVGLGPRGGSVNLRVNF